MAMKVSRGKKRRAFVNEKYLCGWGCVGECSHGVISRDRRSRDRELCATCGHDRPAHIKNKSSAACRGSPGCECVAFLPRQ